jgi:hypothetical protein
VYLITYDGEVLHDPRDVSARVTDATCDLEANTSGTLKFTMPADHPLYGSLAAMSADHEVVLSQADQDGTVLLELFRGRVTDAGEDMKLEREITCEGCLAYLADSIVRPYGTYEDTTDETPGWTTIAPGTARGYAEWLIEQHNRQVDGSKYFKIGKDELDDTSVTRSSTEYPDTLSELKDKVLTAFGCYARTYVQDGVHYIDFLSEGGPDAAQRIEFGENLTDYATTRTVSDVYTAIIPIGKSAAESSDSSSTSFGVDEYSEGPISGYDGMSKVGDRIQYDAGVMKYGLIEKKVSYDSASTLQGLVNAACADLSSASSVVESLSISAVDLSHIDSSLRPIGLLDWVRVTSRPHDVDSYILCLKISIDINDPTQTSYTLGATLPTLTNSNVIREREQRQQIASVIESVKPVDAAAKAAAAAAATAQTTADSKRRVFTEQPTPPYDVGDLWTDTATGITYVCIAAKEE